VRSPGIRPGATKTNSQSTLGGRVS
jgi:hypothetical protein